MTQGTIGSCDTIAAQAKNGETIIYDNEGSFHFDLKGRPFDTIHLGLTEPDVGKNDTTQYFALDFYRSGKICQTYKIAIDYDGQDKAWLFYEDFFNRQESGKQADNRFFKLTAGVPACGYGVTNFLFFVDNGKAELIETWITAGEETYYSDAVFFPKFENNRIKSMVSRYEDMEIYEDSVSLEGRKKTIYSDSAHYYFSNATWSKRIVKPGQYRTAIINHELPQMQE